MNISLGTRYLPSIPAPKVEIRNFKIPHWWAHLSDYIAVQLESHRPHLISNITTRGLGCSIHLPFSAGAPRPDQHQGISPPVNLSRIHRSCVATGQRQRSSKGVVIRIRRTTGPAFPCMILRSASYPMVPLVIAGGSVSSPD